MSRVTNAIEATRCLAEFLRDCLEKKRCAAHLTNPIRFLDAETSEAWEAWQWGWDNPIQATFSE